MYSYILIDICIHINIIVIFKALTIFHNLTKILRCIIRFSRPSDMYLLPVLFCYIYCVSPIAASCQMLIYLLIQMYISLYLGSRRKKNKFKEETNLCVIVKNCSVFTWRRNRVIDNEDRESERRKKKYSASIL